MEESTEAPKARDPKQLPGGTKLGIFWDTGQLQGKEEVQEAALRPAVDYSRAQGGLPDPPKRYERYLKKCMGPVPLCATVDLTGETENPILETTLSSDRSQRPADLAGVQCSLAVSVCAGGDLPRPAGARVYLGTGEFHSFKL